MSTQAAHVAYVERRRSSRFPVRFALIVSGQEGRFQEQTSTVALNAHGALVSLAATVTVGQRLTIHNPDNWAERDGLVKSLGRSYAGRTEVGIEFTEPAPDFWLMNGGSKHPE